MNDGLINKCWDIVSLTNSPILIIKFLEERRIYFIGSGSFTPKNINMPYNEVVDAVDLTDTIDSMFNYHQMTEQYFYERIKNLPYFSFKFSGDDFIWLINKVNR